MNETKTQRPPEQWTAAEVNLSIHYASNILDEINAYAVEGLKQLSRSGIAVGGVLFGSRGEKSVRIAAWRPIHCEHTKGSAFILSQTDRKGLAQSLTDSKSDPELATLDAIGWFVSHMREGVSLTGSDLEVYNHFFPWIWQVALVVRPFRDRPSQAGFFVRDDEGRVKSDASYSEFQMGSAGPRVDRPVHYPVVAEYQPSLNQTPQEEVQPQPVQLQPVQAEPVQGKPVRPFWPFTQARIFSDRRLWIWAAPVLLALIVWAVLEKPTPPPMPASLGFHAVESGGQLRLEWDQSVKPIREAVRGTLYIRDGGAAPVRLELDTAHLAAGNYLYARKSGDLEVVLTVFPGAAAPIEESARFVGPPMNLPKTDDPAELLKQRNALAKENERLRDDLRRESNRNRDLEDAIKALKNRVEVEQSQKQ